MVRYAYLLIPIVASRLTLKSFPLNITVVRDLQSDPIALALLVNFYATEMATALKWSTEHRFVQIRAAQWGLWSGASRMYAASFEKGKHIGILITSRTSKSEIRRLDAVWVAERHRRQGVAELMLAAARKGGSDFHSYSTPAAVDWHKASGFRPLRENPEGTVEMFTGSYVPVYDFQIGMPPLSNEDLVAIQNLKEMEQPGASEEFPRG